MTTSGRAVLFAGCTVIISLLGLFVMNLGFLRGLAVGASSRRARRDAGVDHAAAGRCSASSASTIDRFHVPVRGPSASPATAGRCRTGGAASCSAARGPPSSCASPALHRPRRAGVQPALRLPRRRQQPRATSRPAGPTTCMSRRLRARGQRAPADRRRRRRGRRRGRGRDRASARPSSPTPAWRSWSRRMPSPTGDVALLRHVPEDLARRSRRPRSSSTGCATTCSRRRRESTGCGRSSAASPRRASTPPSTSPAGSPSFIGAVIVLSFLLLMVVFRSMLVPLKAAVMNLLSIGAAYGVVVAGGRRAGGSAGSSASTSRCRCRASSR